MRKFSLPLWIKCLKGEALSLLEFVSFVGHRHGERFVNYGFGKGLFDSYHEGGLAGAGTEEYYQPWSVAAAAEHPAWRNLKGQALPIDSLSSLTVKEGGDAELSLKLPTFHGDTTYQIRKSASGLSGTEVRYGLVDPSVPSHRGCGWWADLVTKTVSEMTTFWPGRTWTGDVGESLAGKTVTLSVYVRCPDEFTLTQTQFTIGLRLGTNNFSESTSNTAINQTISKDVRSRWGWYRKTITHTFSGGAGTQLGATIRVSGQSVHLWGVQVEVGSSATELQSTSYLVRGSKNMIKNSCFPGRDQGGWAQGDATKPCVTTTGSCPPPIWQTGIGAPPGHIEWATDEFNRNFGTGRLRFKPYDLWGQVATKLDFTVNGNSQIAQDDTASVVGATEWAVFSVWARKARTGSPLPNLRLTIRGHDAAHAVLGASAINIDMDLSEHWRLYWIAWPPTTNNHHCRVRLAPGGDNQTGTVEVFGAALSVWKPAWDGFTYARHPFMYESTTSSIGTRNFLKHSHDFTNAVWTKTNCTVTAAAGYAPIEYFDVYHSEQGQITKCNYRSGGTLNSSGTKIWPPVGSDGQGCRLEYEPRIRLNGSAPDRAAGANHLCMGDFWESKETIAGGGHDMFSGAILSAGSYGGKDLLGGIGHFESWTAGVPNGWTDANLNDAIEQETEGWCRFPDESDWTVKLSSLRFTIARACWYSDPDYNGSSTISNYLETTGTFTLTAGKWYLLTCRTWGLQGAGAGSFDIKIVRDGLANGIQKDYVTYGSTAEWLPMWTTRINSPVEGDMSFGATPFFCQTGGNYKLRLGASGYSIGGRPAIDAIELWEDAGLLYPATDEAETIAEDTRLELMGMVPMFYGVVDDVTGGDEDLLSMRVKGYLTGLSSSQTPRMSVIPECNWQFRGASCGYSHTATVASNSSGTTVTVGANETDNLEAGRYVMFPRPNQSSIVLIRKVVSILSGTQFTIDTAATVVSTDKVAYADCRRTFRDCNWRQREFRYGGFRGVAGLVGSVGSQDVTEILKGTELPLLNYWVPSWSATQKWMRAQSPQAQAGFQRASFFSESIVPIAYGRMPIRLMPVEKHLATLEPTASQGDLEYVVGFYVIAAGEIDSIERLYTPDAAVISNQVLASGPSAGKAIGSWWYYRRGLVGEDAWYTEADMQAGYQTNLITNQKRDFRSNSQGSAYSQVAYLIWGQYADANFAVSAEFAGGPDLPDLTADVRGRRVNTYDRDGLVLANAWSQNPIWCLLDFLLDKTHGYGMPRYLIDFQSFVDFAAHCDETINSDTANTFVATNSTNKYVHVDSVAGFAPEMQILHNGVNVRTIKFIDPVEQILTLDSSLTVTAGQTFLGQPKRYTCNLLIDRATKPSQIVDMILATCRGRLTVAGLVGVKVDRPLQGTGTLEQGLEFNPVSVVWGGEKTVNDRMEVVARRGTSDASNGLLISYPRADSIRGETGLLRLSDAQLQGIESFRPMKIALPGVNTPDQAMRCALPMYGKLQPIAGTDGFNESQCTSWTFKTGPIGFVFELGDRIQGKFSSLARHGRVRSMQFNRDFTVDIHVAGERDRIRNDYFGPSVQIFTDSPFTPGEGGGGVSDGGVDLNRPSITLTVSKVVGSKIFYSVTLGNYAAPRAQNATMLRAISNIELHYGTITSFPITVGGPGSSALGTSMTGRRQLTAQVPESLIGTPIYLKAIVRGLYGDGTSFETSNEVGPYTVWRTESSETDPTQQQKSTPYNQVYGGDFEDAAKWTEMPPGGATTNRDPTGDANGAETNQYATRANARDKTTNGDATQSNGTATWDDVNGHDRAESLWNFVGIGASARDGRIKVRCKKQSGDGWQKLYYRLTSGSAWVLLGQVSGTTIVEFTSATLINIDLSQVECRAYSQAATVPPLQYPASKSITGAVMDFWFEEDTGLTGAIGTIGGNLGKVKVYTGTNPGELRRPFPGQTPPAMGQILRSGDVGICRIRAGWADSDTNNNEPLKVLLRNTVTQAEEVLMSIPHTALSTSWKAFAIKFDMSQEMEAPCEIVVSTKNTKGISVDKLGVWLGDLIFRWDVSPQEQGLVVSDTQYGNDAGFAAGDWVIDVLRESTVS